MSKSKSKRPAAATFDEISNDVVVQIIQDFRSAVQDAKGDQDQMHDIMWKGVKACTFMLGGFIATFKDLDGNELEREVSQFVRDKLASAVDINRRHLEAVALTQKARKP